MLTIITMIDSYIKTKKGPSKKKLKKKPKKNKKPQVPQEPVEQVASGTKGAAATEAVVDSQVFKEVVDEKAVKEEVVGEALESDKEEDECTICFEPRNPTFLFFPCGHATFCEDCALRLYKTEEKRCPDCRSPIQATCRVFQ